LCDAIKKVKEFAEVLNEQKRAAEMVTRVLEIESILVGKFEVGDCTKILNVISIEISCSRKNFCKRWNSGG
jgi:hypothetical protein